MKLYKLTLPWFEATGHDYDDAEWYGSLREARIARAEWIRRAMAGECDEVQSDGFAIERIHIAGLAPRALALACLNRAGFSASVTEVVSPVPAEKLRGQR